MRILSVRTVIGCCLLALPVAAFSAEISVDSTSIIRFEQKDFGYKRDYAPATQFLGVHADKLADGNLSAHFYGWGRADLNDRSYNSDVASGSLTYAYLQYRLKPLNADIRAGRFFVHEGIVNEHVDGASIRVDLPYGFGFSTFGGAPVHTHKLFGENTDGKGDGIFGGRLNYRYRGMLELGVSGLYEGDAPALASRLDDGTLRYTNGSRRMVGGDVWFSPVRQVEIMGHTSYNTEADRVAEHTYLLNIKPIRHLVLTGEFNEHRERSFLYSWSMFSGAALNPNELSRSIGGSVSYEFLKGLEVALDYKHYKRDIGDADRFGGDVKLSFLDNSVRTGLGYYYLRADDGFAIPGTPTASYHQLRGYAMHDTKTYFAAVEAIDYIFRDKVFNEGSAWEAQVSLGYHVTPELALSGDFSYGRNPQFTEEVKGLLRLTYNMTFDGKGGKK